MIILRGSFRGA